MTPRGLLFLSVVKSSLSYAYGLCYFNFDSIYYGFTSLSTHD